MDYDQISDWIHIDGQPPSTHIRQQLADTDEPVLLAFSGGKDSIAAWLALRDAGIPVVPYLMEVIPGLSLTEEIIDQFEPLIGQRIIRVPHPSFWRMLNYCVFQPPDRVSLLLEADLPLYTYEQLVGALREHLDMPNAWVCDGVRSADSPVRRLSIATHGPMKHATRKVSVVWDWRKRHVLDRINEAGIPLPADYDLFGRSFDGIDRRFLAPLRTHRPDDYAKILEWFPLAELELIR